MPAASFVHTGGSIAFTRGPLRPDQSLDVIQPQRQSAGGVPFGFAQTIAATIIRLPLRMTAAQKDQLLVFFNTIVNGMAEIFTYTDTSGVALSVRFAIPRLDNIVEKAFGSWETTVELRVAP